MSTSIPAYRLSVYKHKSLDSSEATILTPIAGAPHSDAFQVITMANVSGWKAYLGLPDGRRGRIDPLSKKTDVGEISVPILDVRAGSITDNLTRWLTAFLGDIGDQHQLGGCKAALQESSGAIGTGASGSFTASSAPNWNTNSEAGRTVDFYTSHPNQGGTLVLSTTVTSNTATVLSFTGNATGATVAFVWSNFFTGRVSTIKLRGKLWYDLRIRDDSEVLKGHIFVGKPHSAVSSYAQLFSLLPVGHVKAYGQYIPATPLQGTTDNLDSTANFTHITLTNTSGSRLDNAATADLWGALGGYLVGGFSSLGNTNTPRRFSNTSLLHLKRLDTSAEGDFRVGAIEIDLHSLAGPPGTRRITLGLFIQPLRYPIGVATGTPLVNNGPGYSAGATSIATDGWTISITGILKQGDIISFASHATRYFVTVDTNSNASGQATVTINPPLTASVPDNNAITVQSSPGRMALPPNGTSVELSVVRDALLRDDNPNCLFINDVHPVTLWKNILDGYFGQIRRDDDHAGGLLLPAGTNLGDPKRVIPYDGSAFSALEADTTFPKFRAPISRFMPANEFIEEFICKPYGLGYYLNGSGQVVPVDLRIPSSLAGIVSLTDPDLDTASPQHWEFDDTASVTSAAGTRYEENFVLTEAFGDQMIERVIGPNASFADVSFPAIRYPIGRALSQEFVYENSRGNLFDDQPYEIDVLGLRAQPNETITFASNKTANRGIWADQTLRGLMRIPQRPFGRGPATIKLRCRRTVNVTNTFPGTLHLLQVTSLPDPTTNLRGGTRLVRCLERVERGIGIDFTFLDLGTDTIASAPTLATPTQIAGETQSGAQCAVTLNGTLEPGEVHYAVTETSVGTRPTDGEAVWTFGEVIFQSKTVQIRNLPFGKRIWFRARTFDPSGVKTPSAWAYPTTGFVDLASPSSPSGMATSLITNTTVRLTWTNGSAFFPIKLYLVTPITDPLEFIRFIPSGTTRWDLTQLTANTEYKVEVRHALLGGETTGTSATFTTTNSPSTCPAAKTMSIVVG